jgi:hypothetical protein
MPSHRKSGIRQAKSEVADQLVCGDPVPGPQHYEGAGERPDSRPGHAALGNPGVRCQNDLSALRSASRGIVRNRHSEGHPGVDGVVKIVER